MLRTTVRFAASILHDAAHQLRLLLPEQRPRSRPRRMSHWVRRTSHETQKTSTSPPTTTPQPTGTDADNDPAERPYTNTGKLAARLAPSGTRRSDAESAASSSALLSREDGTGIIVPIASIRFTSTSSTLEIAEATANR